MSVKDLDTYIREFIVELARERAKERPYVHDRDDPVVAAARRVEWAAGREVPQG